MTQTEQLLIRDALPTERAAITTLTMAAYQEYATIMTPGGWAGLHSAVSNALAGEPDATRIVALLDGRLVGSVMLCPPAKDAYGGAVSQIDWPEIRLLAVDQTVRGHGIGTALLNECIERARLAGYHAVGLHSSKSLAVAIRMYERMGFVRNPSHDFQPDDAELVMAFRLDLVS